jgi:hypothetical protein
MTIQADHRWGGTKKWTKLLLLPLDVISPYLINNA